MNPKVMIIASGEKVDEKKVESTLRTIQGLKLQTGVPERGIATGATKAVKWVAEFLGGSSKVAELLIGQATKEFAGASIKIQVEGKVVEINNVNRSQIIDVLDRAAEIAKKQDEL